LARVGVLTLNEHEVDAAASALSDSGYRKLGTTREGNAADVVYRVWEYTNDVHEVRLVHQGVSGNLITSLVAAKEFGSDTFLMWVLFGCAGAIPLEDEKYPRVGAVVLVTEAMYAENGVVQERAAREQVLVKTGRIERMSVQLVAGRTRQVLDRIPILGVKAFCSEKVMKIKPSASLQGSPTGVHLAPYWACLEDFGALMVDMETYGFLAAAGPARHERCIAIRVLTDSLVDQESSARSVEENVATAVAAEVALRTQQQSELRRHGHVLPDILALFDAAGDPISPPGEPLVPMGEPRFNAEQVAEQTTRDVGGSGGFRARVRELAANLLARLGASHDDADRAFASGLAKFLQRGYGSPELVYKLRALYGLTEATGSELVLPTELLFALDPGASPEKYSEDLRRALLHWFGNRGWILEQAAPYSIIISRKNRPDGDHAPVRVLLVLGIESRRVQAYDLPVEISEEVRWSGLDDDERLAAQVEVVFGLQRRSRKTGSQKSLNGA
jgi:nucleoside phosphorylase